VRRTPRAVYEGMTRGDLIDALVAAEAEPSPNNVRRLEQLEVERAELEEQLRILRERSERAEIARATFADLFANAPAPYCVLDRNGVIEDANDAAATLFCMDAGALERAQLFHVVDVAERQTLLAHLARCLDERLRVSCELTMVVRGRGEICVQLVSTPRLRREGWADACRTIFHDVTRTRRAAAASEFLAHLDDAFGDSVETNDAASAIARACVPTLGDAVFVDLICDDGAPPLRRAGLALEGRHAAARETMARHAEDPSWLRYVQRVLETRAAVFEPSSGAAFSTEIPAKAFLLVPLIGRNKPIGVLGALRMDEGAYTVEQLELAHHLARRAARTLETTLALGSPSSAR